MSMSEDVRATRATTAGDEIAHRAISLLEDVRRLHRDKDASEYNECERSECAWCEEADAVIARLKAPRPASSAPDDRAEADALAEILGLVLDLCECPPDATFKQIARNALARYAARREQENG